MLRTRAFVANKYITNTLYPNEIVAKLHRME